MALNQREPQRAMPLQSEWLADIDPMKHKKNYGLFKRLAMRLVIGLIEALVRLLVFLRARKLFVIFSVGPVVNSNINIKTKTQMTVTLTDTQQFAVSIKIEDARGNVATTIAPPVWSVSDPALLTVTAAADGLSATVVAVGPVGTGQVTVAGDGGPAAGDDAFTGILDVVVTGGKATQVVFAPTAPTEQTTPAA